MGESSFPSSSDVSDSEGKIAHGTPMLQKILLTSIDSIEGVAFVSIHFCVARVLELGVYTPLSELTDR